MTPKLRDANPWASRFRDLPDDARDFIKAECDAGEHCICPQLTGSLVMSNPADYRMLASAERTVVVARGPGEIRGDS